MPAVPRIVAFSAKAGSGKTTASELLTKVHGYKRYAFADPLKSVCKHLYLLSQEQLYGDQKEVVDPRWGMSPRQILQRVGTDIVRQHIGIDHWVKLFREWFKSLGGDTRVVIDDVRFKEEADVVRELGGVVISIVRDGLDDVGDAGHASESLNGIVPNNVIYNDGSISDLYDKVNAVVLGCGVSYPLKRGITRFLNPRPDDTLLSVMTFNVLAQMNVNGFDSTTPEMLTLDKRLPMIVREITQYRTDVVCVQELDFYDELYEELARYGYEGIRFERHGKHSVAMFYQHEYLDVVHVNRVSYMTCTQQALIVEFAYKFSRRTVVVANTHLKSKPQFSFHRKAQFSELLTALKKESYEKHNIIICGDFNDSPGVVQDGYPFMRNMSPLSNVFNSDRYKPTTCKSRDGKEDKRTSDYILCNNYMAATYVICPNVSAPMPNAAYPSDHQAIVAEFIVNDVTSSTSE